MDTVGAWRWLVRAVRRGDPETGLLAKVALTLTLLVNLDGIGRPGQPGWVAGVLVAGLGGWLLFLAFDGRRSWLGLSGVLLAAAAGAVTAGPVTGSTALVLNGVAVATFANHLLPRLPVISVVTAADLAVLAASSLWWHRSSGELLLGCGVLAIVVLLGLYRRQYRIRVQQTEELLVQTQRAQQEQARAAALDERNRIARELHDVLAHSLGALAIQLEVAEGLLADRRDPAAALARVRTSRRLATDGLAEARNAVAALRCDIPPLPEALAELVTATRRDHQLAAELTVDGAPRELPPPVAVSVLRTAREALTNAARHAPGAPVTVRLSYLDDHVRLTVHNAAPGLVPSGSGGDGGGAGHGLVGMRERIALAGGTLTAGADPDGGWRVRMEVPG